MFRKILIADRGEIALRILRACRALDIQTVAVYSEADRDADYLRLADEAVCIGPAAPQLSYQSIQAILSAAEVTDAEAIHPGYGFLSNSVELAELSESCGFTFIGPRAETLRMMRNKLAVREAVKALKIPRARGSEGALPIESREILRIARETGYPVLIKPTHGYGGRGQRIVHHESALLDTVTIARNEATILFGTSTVYLEKLLERPRHLKFQVIADAHRNALYLGHHECTLRASNTRMLEETPAPGIVPRHLARLGERCAEVCRRFGIQSLVSFEFLYQDGDFFFLDLSTRIQVEHPLIEATTGIDLVHEQLRVATGEKLHLRTRDIEHRGHAIECRIHAEEPYTGTPSPGTLIRYQPPGGPGIRVDSHAVPGYRIPAEYSPLIAKVIAHGTDREQAIRRMRAALAEMRIDGVDSNLALHRDVLSDPDFLNGQMTIHTLEKRRTGIGSAEKDV